MVTAAGELVQIDVLGQQPPLAVPAGVVRRVRIVGGDDHGDRRGQPHRRCGVEGVGEVSVGRHAVVAVGGGHVLGTRPVQLGELAVAAVTAQLGGDLGVAAAGQRLGRGAPPGGVAEQLRAEEHALDLHAPLLQPPGGLHRQGGARGVAPQQDPGQSAAGDLLDHRAGHLRHRGERLVAGGRVVAGQFDGVDRAARGPQGRGQWPEVHRVAAGVREAHQGAVRFAVRLRQGLQQSGPGRRPAVDDLGEVGEDRVGGDVLEGDRAVQQDRQPHGRQGGAAAVEEVVPAPDPLLRDAEHRRPRLRQAQLGVGAGGLPVRLRGVPLGALRGRRGQGLAVDLAVGGERQALPPVEGRGDHVGGQEAARCSRSVSASTGAGPE